MAEVIKVVVAAAVVLAVVVIEDKVAAFKEIKQTMLKGAL